uniref:Uncharacterized protein n=1 Tax=Arundo donax TaxID=35708 RepID=A0A0A9F3L1_ARUDO
MNKTERNMMNGMMDQRIRNYVAATYMIHCLNKTILERGSQEENGNTSRPRRMS